MGVQELVENEFDPVRHRDVTELLRGAREVVRRLERVENWFLGEAEGPDEERGA